MPIAGSWQVLAISSACLLGPAAAARVARRWPRLARPAWEAGLMLALFALWEFAGSNAAASPGGAWRRAWWIWHAERAIHLPSEAALQDVFLPHPALVEAANLFYGALHFPVFIACLIWLFTRHRNQYAHVRTTIVIFTAAALLVELVPVAPPRMVHPDGMIDTGIRYGQSVYSAGTGFEPDQFAAMPSVHVGWALLIAITVVEVSRRRLRWLALLYPVLTSVDVVITANHFWLDEIAAALLLALALLLQRGARAARTTLALRSAGAPRLPGRLPPARPAGSSRPRGAPEQPGRAWIPFLAGRRGKPLARTSAQRQPPRRGSGVAAGGDRPRALTPRRAGRRLGTGGHGRGGCR